VLSGVSSLVFENFNLRTGQLLYDISTGAVRPLVPVTHRRQVFQAVHSIDQPGIRATITRTVRVPVQSIPLPSRRFAHLHVDIVGPLPMSKGFTYVFTMIDRSTRWVEVVPLTTTDCAVAMVREWVACFGVLDTVTSDRGGPIHVYVVGGGL
jgi:cleavage and polyadenylation specificity factor subunit 1